MKCSIPEISWHNRDPVLTVDIQPLCNGDFYRLATGGADCHVLIWHLKIRDNGRVNVDVVCDLTKHQRSVNVVRWSPTGKFLASGDDDASIIIWNLKIDNLPVEGETDDKETWIVYKVLRGHIEDVYDICWSPTETKLLSGSIDNTAIIWDFKTCKNERILGEHKGFVQGVAWDPKHQYIATLSSDRICRVYDTAGKQVKFKAHKGILPVSNSHPLHNKEVKYFHDDTLKSYFRRLSFSPDGNLLITPSGCVETEDRKTGRYASYVFLLESTAQPVAILPSPKQITIAVRCCPILYELRCDGTDPIIDLPYRMIFAIGTNTDIVLYDTQQLAPFAHLQNIHYTRITDITWSLDGLLLIASSTDGYCTLITFDPDELGIEYSNPEESALDTVECQEPVEVSKIEKIKSDEEIKVKKPSMLDQWTIRKPKNELEAEEQVSSIDSNSTTKVNTNTSTKATRKRIVPTKIDDSKTASKKVLSKDAVVTTETHDVSKKALIDNISEEEKNVSHINKRKTEIKEVTGSPLLKYFKPNVKATKEETEVSDKTEVASLKSNLKVNKNEVIKETEIIEINDDSNDSIFAKNEKVNYSESSLKSNLKVEKNEIINQTEIIEVNDDSNDVVSANNKKVDYSETNSLKVSNGKTVAENSTDETAEEVKCIVNKSAASEKENLTEVVPESSGTEPSSSHENIVTIQPKAIRRIPLVTLSSPKRTKKN